MGQAILATRTLRSESWARNNCETHSNEIATCMYKKVQGMRRG